MNSTIQKGGMIAAHFFRAHQDNEMRAVVLALNALIHGHPRGVYEVAMEYFWKNDFLKCIAYTKLCLKHAPDWDYGFCAKHNIAVCYEKLGLFKRARLWAKLASTHYPELYKNGRSASKACFD